MKLSPVLVLVLAVLVPTLCVNIEGRRCELKDQLKSALSSKNQKEYKLARVICEVEKFAKASSMNPTNPSSMNPTNPSSINPTNGSSMNPTNPSSINPTNPSSMNPTNPSSINPTNASSMNPTNPSSMNPNNGSSMNPTNASSMNPTNAPNTTGLFSPTSAPSTFNTQPSTTASRRLARALDSGEDSSEDKKSGKGDAGAYLKDCVVVTKGASVTVDATCLGKNWVFEKVYLNAGEDCKKISPKDFFQNCSNSAKPDSGESDTKQESKPKPESKSKPEKKSRN